MSEEFEREKLFYFVILVTVLVLAYIFLLWFGFYEEAKFLAELISILVIALASYYLGYSKTKKSQVVEKAGVASQIKKNLHNTAIFFVVLGIVLVIVHAVFHGVTFTINSVFTNHLYIGLYSTGCGFAIYAIAKKIKI